MIDCSESTCANLFTWGAFFPQMIYCRSESACVRNACACFEVNKNIKFFFSREKKIFSFFFGFVTVFENELSLRFLSVLFMGFCCWFSICFGVWTVGKRTSKAKMPKIQRPIKCKMKKSIWSKNKLTFNVDVVFHFCRSTSVCLLAYRLNSIVVFLCSVIVFNCRPTTDGDDDDEISMKISLSS